MRAWRAKNPTKYREYNKKYREKNLERYKGLISAWAKANPEKIQTYHLRKTYGISLADKNAILAAQGGRCGICNSSSPGSKRGWQVDADHSQKPAKVRGILCVRCNTSIGQFDHNPEFLMKAAAWLTIRR
jgi:Recombination endonuclease VII